MGGGGELGDGGKKTGDSGPSRGAPGARGAACSEGRVTRAGIARGDVEPDVQPDVRSHVMSEPTKILRARLSPPTSPCKGGGQRRTQEQRRRQEQRQDVFRRLHYLRIPFAFEYGLSFTEESGWIVQA